MKKDEATVKVFEPEIDYASAIVRSDDTPAKLPKVKTPKPGKKKSPIEFVK